MPYEPTTKGNPKQLVVDQHFHTAHAISLFYDSDEKVEVMELSSGEIVKRHKRAKIFCTKRTWDERAETGYMADIENAFHNEIDNIKSFSDRDHQAISKYCLLWRLRHEYHLSSPEDVVLNGVSGSGFTKEQEEILESKHTSFVREGGVWPARSYVGVRIQTDLHCYFNQVRDVKWGLVEAQDGEFIVADGYGELAFIPISPKLAFCAGQSDQKINRQLLSKINRESVSRAKEYYFARKISECPID